MLLVLIITGSCNYGSVVYITHQAKGQLKILIKAKSFNDYVGENELSREEKQNLELISLLKVYSVKELGFKPTGNFTKIYNQNNDVILWVITASEKNKINAYLWNYPIVGKVSYKGFFDKNKALAEKNKLIVKGYDVDLRSVSAWSTLGWFNDPVLSGMLKKSKGNLCNLIFHELFHATYYAESSVDFNENLASFIAHKATIKYLGSDTLALKNYLTGYSDNEALENKIQLQITSLNRFYDSIADFNLHQKQILKLKRLYSICSSLDKIKINDSSKIPVIKSNILQYKNAWFVDFNQYNSLQDSLEYAFNKFYHSDIRKMVQSLK